MSEGVDGSAIVQPGANCHLIYKYSEFGNEFPGVCLRLSGTEIVFKTAQELETGRAVEIRILPEHFACPAITAFVEIAECNASDQDQYEVSATINGIMAN